MPENIAARARAIIDANAYMTLATSDREGLPWATPGTAHGVYMGATATEVGDDELEPAVSVFSERSLRHGAGPVGRADVRAPAEHRLYRATAYEVFISGDRDQRIPVALG